MDDIAIYNSERWDALADASAVFTRPALDLDPAQARVLIIQKRNWATLPGNVYYAWPVAEASSLLLLRFSVRK